LWITYRFHLEKNLRELFVCKIYEQQRRTKSRSGIVSGVGMSSKVWWYEHALFLLPLPTHGQISLGDARSYYITTARNDLGVIFATSEAGSWGPRPHSEMMEVADNLLLVGGTMEPVSWQEMRCPKTGKLEKRKCAKPE
jgi:hypothetical protein